MKELGPQFLGSLRCTSDRATAEPWQAFGKRMTFAHAGDEIHVPAGPSGACRSSQA